MPLSPHKNPNPTRAPCLSCGKSTLRVRGCQVLTPERLQKYHYLGALLQLTSEQQPAAAPAPARLCRACFLRHQRRHDKSCCCPPRLVAARPKQDDTIANEQDMQEENVPNIQIEKVIDPEEKTVQECVFVENGSNNKNVKIAVTPTTPEHSIVEQEEQNMEEAEDIKNFEIEKKTEPKEITALNRVSVENGSKNTTKKRSIVNKSKTAKRADRSTNVNSNISVKVKGHIRLTANTTTCLVKDCYNEDVIAISDALRYVILSDKDMLIPPGALICNQHNEAGIWHNPSLKDCLIWTSDFTPDHIMEIIHLLKKKF